MNMPRYAEPMQIQRSNSCHTHPRTGDCGRRQPADASTPDTPSRRYHAHTPALDRRRVVARSGRE